MSEMAKTVVFVVVGVAALGMALLVDVASRPKESGASTKDQVGKPLFKDFDALDVTGPSSGRFSAFCPSTQRV